MTKKFGHCPVPGNLLLKKATLDTEQDGPEKVGKEVKDNQQAFIHQCQRGDKGLNCNNGSGDTKERLQQKHLCRLGLKRAEPG